MLMQKHYDVIIVGAGLSGLTSAVKILHKERSLHVKILEKANSAGGQLVNSRLGEIGARWITEDQYHVRQLLSDLNIPMRKRVIGAADGKRCWDLDEGYTSKLAKFELYRYLRELELRVYAFKPGRYDQRLFYELMSDHINHRLFFQKSRTFVNNMVQLMSGVPSTEIYYDEFMRICYTNGSIQTLLDLYIECPSDVLWEFSTEKLVESLVEELRFSEVLYKRQVREIRHYKEFVDVHDVTGEVHRADVVIMAVPWNNIEEIEILPAIPTELARASRTANHKKLKLTSFLASYDEPHWRADGRSGNLFTNEPFFVVGNEYRPTTYSGFMVHEAGEPSDDLGSIVLQTLAKYFGDSMLSPNEFNLHTFEMSSMSNYPLTTPWNRIIWSSSAASATCFRGCLGGAVQSGMRAAMNAMLLIRPQTVSWQDIATVQVFRNMPRRRANYLSIWLSAFNLYNVTFYSMVSYTVLVALRFLYRHRHGASLSQ